MNQALSREKLFMDLWSKKPVSSSDSYVLEDLVDLHSKGYVSSVESPVLTDKGLQYVLHGRETNDLVEFLADVDVSQEERAFLANAIKEIIDKPFAYEIIKTAAENPNRKKYPSVDLGAYVDVEHGVLFGAETHIMIDPLLRQKNLSNISRNLEAFGANVKGFDVDSDTTRIEYTVGDSQKELYVVESEAMNVGPNITRMVENGISALMMKGRGGDTTRGFGSLLEEVEHYIPFLVGGGILLTGVRPKAKLEKIGEGMLAYWTHLDQNYRLSQHGLYLKKVKG